jgi:hypothetical protein
MAIDPVRRRITQGYFFGGIVVVITIVAGGGFDDGGTELSGGSVDPVCLVGSLDVEGLGAQATTPIPIATTSTILRNIPASSGTREPPAGPTSGKIDGPPRRGHSAPGPDRAHVG